MNDSGDLSYSPATHGTVYGLVASDEPLQIRYVGQTITPPVLRLQSHLSRYGSRGSAGPWMREVRERGAQVRLRILGEYPIAELSAAERQWIQFWGNYCQLANRAGLTKQILP